MIRICVLTLTKNSGRWLKDVLEPIKKQKSEYDVKLVLVDGWSTDDTIKIARQYFPDVIIVKNGSRNLAHLRNIALEQARQIDCDYMCWIDSDVVVPDNFFQRMLNILAIQNAGIAGLRFELERDPPKGFVAKFYRDRRDICRSGIHETDYTTTACSMWKANLIKDIYLDERLKRAGEDVDFNLKITEQGYKAFVDADNPPAWHIRPATVKEELHRVKDHGLARSLLIKTHPNSIYPTRKLKTLLATGLVFVGWIGLFLAILSPWIGLWTLSGLLPFAGYFFRHWMKCRDRRRLDYAFFGFLMGVIYFTRFLEGVVMY